MHNLDLSINKCTRLSTGPANQTLYVQQVKPYLTVGNWFGRTACYYPVDSIHQPVHVQRKREKPFIDKNRFLAFKTNLITLIYYNLFVHSHLSLTSPSFALPTATLIVSNSCSSLLTRSILIRMYTRKFALSLLNVSTREFLLESLQKENCFQQCHCC